MDIQKHSMRILPLVIAAALPGPTDAQVLDHRDDGPVVALRQGIDRADLRAEHISGSTVEVDGILDEAAWATAPVFRGFVQGEPVEGAPAQEDTEVRVLFGPDAVFVSARLHDSEPETIAAQLVRRDGRGSFDWFAASFDPDLDGRTGYRFQVSAAGVQADAYLYDDDRSDDAWDAVWSSAVSRDSGGWTAEMRIPYSQIRFSGGEEPQTWGVNFTRRRVQSAETSYYVLQSRLDDAAVSRFARLDGVDLEQGGMHFEARPYLSSRLDMGPAAAGDPFFDGRAAAVRVGGDLTLGLGSTFRLDATINPDFGQVESDPAEINLSAFESFLQERRPFFVEDARLLDFRLSGWRDQLFYSRRIGRSPRGNAPGNPEFTTVPEASTILGALKFSGRTEDGLALGGLVAMTDGVTGRAAYDQSSGEMSFLAEPRAGYGVVRAEQTLHGGRTSIGGIATAVRREIPSEGAFDFLPSQAFSAGIDFEHRWAGGAWALGGYFAGSHVRGKPEAITRIQRASNHYFQRPDAAESRLDSTATSITGASWRLSLDKRGGGRWTGSVWLGQTTPGFEINELGFSRSAESLDLGVRLGLRGVQPGRVFRSYTVGLSTSHEWSHDALDRAGSLDSWRRGYQDGEVSLDARGELLNYWGLSGGLTVRPDRYSRSATRGGPIMLQPGELDGSLSVSSDRRRPLSLSARAGWSTDMRGGGGGYSVGAGIQVRPSPTIEIELEPRWSVRATGAQYVAATSAVPYQPTFERRYLFAELERSTLSFDARVDLALSPTLTFQLYSQTLLSSGDYLSYRQLAKPGAWEFVDFEPGEAVVASPDADVVDCLGGSICRVADSHYVDFDGDARTDFRFPDRDFVVRSLLGNAVLRWEFNPGSTLYLVWQRAQSGRSSLGSLDLGRDLDALWAIPAEDTFMLKVSYWLGF